MKKRIVAMVLAVALVTGLTMPVMAVNEPDNSVENTGTGLTLLNSIPMDTSEQDTFLAAPSGNPPEIPEAGFLQELNAPLKSPGENGLMTEVGQPEDGAQEIASVEQLLAITSGSYYLSCDLDLSGITEWTGISPTDAIVLDGQGHTIRGLSGTLFSYAYDLTIRNLLIEIAEAGISGKAALAEVLYYPLHMDNVTVRGNVIYDAADTTSYDYMGGFVGKADDSTNSVTNCAFIGTVDDSANTYYYSACLGGFFGEYRGTMSDCYFSGSVLYGRYTGGMIGYATSTTTMSRCQAHVTQMLSGSTGVGGIAGSAPYVSFTDCCVTLAEGAVITEYSPYNNKAFLGGIAGYANAIQNCWVRGGSINGTYAWMYLGGIAGYLRGNTGFCYAVTSMSIVKSSNSSYLGGVTGFSVGAVTDCCADLTVTGNPSYACYTGGIVGKAGMTVERCYAQGDVSGLESDAASFYNGGIAAEANVTDCYAKVNNAYRGIVNTGIVRNCYVNGPLTLRGPGIGGTKVVNCAVRNVTCEYAGITIRGDASGCLIVQSTINTLQGSTSATGVGGIAYDSEHVSDCTVMGCTINAVGNAGGILANTNGGYDVAGTSIYNCTVTDTVITGYTAGGIAGTFYDGTLTDCKTENVTVTATGDSGYAGGIAGSVTQNGYVLACTSNADVTGPYAGGIAGYDSTGLIQSCVANGTVNGSVCAGGVAGIYANTQLTDCISNADVAGGQYVGGLVGDLTATITNCEANGTLNFNGDESIDSFMGGLVGRISAEVHGFYDCTFNGEIEKAAKYTGGLLGQTYNYDTTIDNCHVTKKLEPSAVVPDCGLGGLVGQLRSQVWLYLLSCTTAGMDVSGDVSYFGGLTGQSYGYLKAEHCTINGDISCTDDTDEAYCGTFCGVLYDSSYLADDWCYGDVVFSAKSEEETIGILAGYRWSVLGYYQCGIRKESSDPEFAIEVNGARDSAELVGKARYENMLYPYDSYEYYQNDDVQRNVIINVFGGYIGGESGFPLSGAKVTIGEYTGYTDMSGKVEIPCSADAFQSGVVISVERDGYDPTYAYHRFTTNNSVYSVTMWRLDPGRIFISGGSVALDEGKSRKMFSTDRVYFGLNDDIAYPVTVDITWNGHEPEMVYLRGAESGKIVQLTPTAYGAYGNVCFGASFESQEPIQICAQTTNGEEYGILTDHRLTCWKVQPLQVNIVVQEEGDGSTLTDGKEESTFFLESSKLKFDLGDLGDCAASMSLQNGILTITFKDEDKHKTESNLFSAGDAFVKDSISLSGSVSIPYFDPAYGKWSGKIDLGFNGSTGFSDMGQEEMKKKIDAVEKDLPIHEMIHVFYVGYVPCYVQASVGAYGGAKLEIYGSIEEAGASGTLYGGFKGEVGGGVGGSIAADELQYNDHAAIEVMAGLYGQVNGNVDVKLDTNTGVTVNPKIKGEIGGKVTVHLFFFDLEEKLTLGTFEWDPEGLVWTFVGNSGSIGAGRDEAAALTLLAMTDDDWQLLERTGGKIQLMEDSNAYIANISYASDIALGEYSNYEILYYTDDDLTVEAAQNAMKLYAAVNGGEAIVLDDTATSDHSPSASGKYVTWVDVKEIADASLSDFLMSSEIAVSMYDGTAFSEKTILSNADENTHVYAPVMTRSSNSDSYAAVAWLQSDILADGELNLMPAQTEIWYSIYDGTNWCEAQKACTVDGDVRSLHASLTGSSADDFKLELDYQVDDVVNRITAQADGTVSEPALWLEDVHHYVRPTDVVRSIYTWQNESGLFIGQYSYNGSSYVFTGTTHQISDKLNESPVIVPQIYEGLYAYWAIGNEIWRSERASLSTTWSTPQLVAAAPGTVRELQAYENYVAYLAETEEGTNLYYHTVEVQNVIDSVFLTEDAVEVTVHGDTSGRWTLTDGGDFSLSGSFNFESETQGTFLIGREDLPESGSLTITVDNDSETFELVDESKPAKVTIADHFWDGNVLNAYVLAEDKASGNMVFTLTDAAGQVVMTWDEGTGYEPDSLYLAQLEADGLADGIYELTVTVNDVSSAVYVGWGDPLAPQDGDLMVDACITDENGTEINLSDRNSMLDTALIAMAAQYDSTTGQMLDVLYGSATNHGDGLWTIQLPGQADTGWTLFLLDSEGYSPVCEPIVLN